MPEIEPMNSPEEGEKMSLDQEFRALAEKLGIVETEKINEHTTLDNLDLELTNQRENNPQATFLAYAALLEAALHIQASNPDAAYNNLADAYDILNNEQIHPEVLVQIEALMAQL